MMTSSRAAGAKAQERQHDDKDDTTTRTSNDHPTESTASSMEWERKVTIVKKYYQMKGYRVHSGLQFGCELVLYVDSPEVSNFMHMDIEIHITSTDMFVVIF